MWGLKGGRCSHSSLKTFENRRLLSQAGAPGRLHMIQHEHCLVLHGLKTQVQRKTDKTGCMQ